MLPGCVCGPDLLVSKQFIKSGSYCLACKHQERKSMFKLIEGLPQNVMAIEASGTVTHEDYRDLVIPKTEAMAAKGPIKLFYVIGPDFTGFEAEALWDDSKLGFMLRHDFSYVAIVSNVAWIRTSVSLFKPFFHCEVRLFSLTELAAAKDWITNAK
jgi:hypothetical protein